MAEGSAWHPSGSAANPDAPNGIEAISVGSDSSYGYDDYDEDSSDRELTLDDIHQSKTINFPIRATYTNWEPREAFRELLQNWRDAIVRQFRLNEKDFHVIRQERVFGRSQEIVYKVPKPGRNDTQDYLGYIHFKARDGFGTIDITNRNATLQPSHLDLGGTTKANASNQAGAHGEGLKIALLVLMRYPQNHGVRCSTGNFNWRFNFTTRGRLVARLSRMSPEAVRRSELKAAKQSAGRSMLPFAARPGQDVQFIIGEPRQGRDDLGTSIKRERVSRENFDNWTKSALFLHVDTDGAIISTAHGDLLTSETLTGNIYLKGLLLYETTPWRSASITNQPLKFGYNFAHGRTNRERQSVAGAEEEAASILAIWKSVLLARPDMVKELSDMLNAEEPQYADVSRAKRNIDFDTGKRLHDYLTGEQFGDKWYYCAGENSQNSRLSHIIQGLGCEAVVLTKTYWTILCEHGFFWTAEEEEQGRFTTAPEASIPDSLFATSVCRLLKNCMQSCRRTADITLRFVQAGSLHLPLYFLQTTNELLIHDRWLNVDSVMEELGLSEDALEHDTVFHAVERLFTSAMDQLPSEAFLEGEDSRTMEWKKSRDILIARQNLLNYFRMASLDVGMNAAGRELRLTWPFDSRWNADACVSVQCHQNSRCAQLREDILAGGKVNFEEACTLVKSESPASSTRPPCRYWLGNLDSRSHSESELEEGEEYFFVLLMSAGAASFPHVSDVRRVPSRPIPAPYSLRGPNRSTMHYGPIRNEPGAIRSTEASQRSHLRDRSLSPPISNGTGHDSEDDMNIHLSGPTETLHRAASTMEGRVRSGPSRRPQRSSTGIVTSEATAASNGSHAAVYTQTTSDQRSRRQASPPAVSFTLGEQVHSFDILTIDPKRCYKAEDSEGVKAIVAITHGQRLCRGETRKRRRAEGSPA